MLKKIFILILFLAVFLPYQQGMADVVNPHWSFSKKFNLVVHQGNRDRPVPRAKALEIILNYTTKNHALVAFSGQGQLLKDVKIRPLMVDNVKYACQEQLIDCDLKRFRPYQPVTQKEILMWMTKLEGDKSAIASEKDASAVYRKAWVAARQKNLLPDNENEMTYDALSELLYRDHVIEENEGQPYLEGLVTDLSEINRKNYHNLFQIDRILGNIYTQMALLKKIKKLSPEEGRYLENLKKHQEAFRELREGLGERPYLLEMKPDYPPEVTRAIREYELQEVLAEYHYDYSKNEAYRQHNLITGLMKMNGRVVMPDEEVSHWKAISDKNLTDFKEGWVIVNGGDEAWQWGGGICGTSTGVFNPVWKSGIEIVERRPHTVYYTTLYATEDIGLDATVYRPKPDFRYRNNLGSPIAFYVKDETEKKVISLQLLGNSPYRRVKIEGPVYKSKREVEWTREMEYFDGTKQKEVLASRYNAVR